MRIAIAGGTGTAGRYAMVAARAAGHDAVSLSRADGVDIVAGVGLDRALVGVDVIVDTLNGPTTRRERATAFFVDAARSLQQAGVAAGVSWIIVLSIVGIDRVPGFGYYDAKRAQEAAALAGPVPVTIVRSTQFHEFAGQLLDRMSVGPLAPIPTMRVPPVAARTVGEHLVAAATDPDVSDRVELAGPEVIELVELARRTVVRGHEKVGLVTLSWVPDLTWHCCIERDLSGTRRSSCPGPWWTRLSR